MFPDEHLFVCLFTLLHWQQTVSEEYLNMPLKQYFFSLLQQEQQQSTNNWKLNIDF